MPRLTLKTRTLLACHYGELLSSNLTAPLPQGEPTWAALHPAWHGAGHHCFFRPAEPLILGWKQSAREPVSEEQHYPYLDAHRADLEQGALGPTLMAA